MTIANTFAAKLSVAFVAVAMALSMVAPAQAQTAEELQAQIDTLMATIASLQSTTVTTTTVSTSAYVFTRPLTIGSQGADVTALQTYLIAGGYSIPAGATGYFGGQTQAAVAAWQTANMVMPAAGYFGPVSQAKYNALMAATPTTPTTPDEEDEDEDTDSDELQGEASLDKLDVEDGDDTDVEEGQEAAPVADIKIEFTDGDAKITRLDIALDNTTDGNDEVDPWDVFEEVSLWVDGDEVATMTADDEDEYLDEDFGTLRFSDLDIVAMEDEEVVVTVAVTVQGSVDGTNDGSDWDVAATGLRFVDADDVTSTETTSFDLQNAAAVYTADTAEFIIEEEGGEDEIIVKSSPEDPDSTTLTVDESDKSDFTTFFAFDLDTDDSVNDITVNEIVVNVKTNDAGGTDDVISDLVLVIDGEEYDDWTIGAANALVTTYTFDTDGDLVIEAGDRAVAELQAEFRGLTGNYAEGATIQATTTGTTLDAEGADDLTGGQLSGTASGDVHTLRSSGAVLEGGDVSETLKENSNTTAVDDEGVFTLKFDVTAFETDLYIAKSAASTTGSSVGAGFRITNGSGTLVGTSSTPSASLSSTASSETGSDSVSRFVVNEGETETFTLTVTYSPLGSSAAFYGVQLYGLNYKIANTGAATVFSQLALPAEDFETDPLSI